MRGFVLHYGVLYYALRKSYCCKEAVYIVRDKGPGYTVMRESLEYLPYFSNPQKPTHEEMEMLAMLDVGMSAEVEDILNHL